MTKPIVILSWVVNAVHASSFGSRNFKPDDDPANILPEWAENLHAIYELNPKGFTNEYDNEYDTEYDTENHKENIRRINANYPHNSNDTYHKDTIMHKRIYHKNGSAKAPLSATTFRSGTCCNCVVRGRARS